MRISTDTNPKINPAELRFLRAALNNTSIGCKQMAMQAIVTYAALHDGIDLSDEARYLTAEMAAPQAMPHLSASNQLMP
jgi:hypothetical protein